MITDHRNLDTDHDVLVLGSGASGLVAAVRAARGGRRVLVLEKDDRLGGTSAVGGGVMWVPGNHLMSESGWHDTREGAAAYLHAATDGRMDDAWIDWYLDTAPRAVRFLTEEAGVRLRALGRPDYHQHLPGAASGGRGLDNDPFDPAPHEGLAELVRPPTYFPPISMAERDALQGDPVDPAVLEQRRRDGLRTMGGALVGRLLVAAAGAGVHVAHRARVTGLERSDSGAWRVESGAGTFTAPDVVLASGGFEWNPRLRAAFLAFPVTPISAPSNEGDGLELAMGAGASLDLVRAVWGVPVITPPDARYDGRPSGRMGNVEMTLPGSVTVNVSGRRFVNEAVNYHDLNRVFGNVEPGTGRLANQPAWLVMDHEYVRRYSVAGSVPGDPEDWMATAETPRALAEVCGIDPVGLERTLERFNTDARAGVDTQFGRGSSPQDRHLGDPDNTPNPCLRPVEHAPFYAVPVSAGVLGTAGGLTVDTRGRVLGGDGHPVDGLYAAGNVSASVFRDAYPGGGATLGSAVTRGFAVGEHLASRTRV